jgi:hypothetical protein
VRLFCSSASLAAQPVAQQSKSQPRRLSRTHLDSRWYREDSLW